MAEHASGEIIINSTLMKVLEILLELDEYPQLISDVVKIDVHDRDKFGRAKLATLTTNAMGKVIEQKYEYSYENYPNEITWTFVEGNMVKSLNGRYRLDERGPQTTNILYELDMELTAPLPGFLKKKAAQKIVDSALKSLKIQAEK